MAYPVEITLGTGNKVSVNYQSQEVSIAITYQLEPDETNVLAVVAEKARELMDAHAVAWAQVKGEASHGISSQMTQGVTGQGDRDTQEMTSTSAKEASRAQIELIRSLSEQAGLSENNLEARTLAAYGCALPEELTEGQAATLILDLGREGRGRFDQERIHVQQQHKTPDTSL